MKFSTWFAIIVGVLMPTQWALVLMFAVLLVLGFASLWSLLQSR